MKDSEVWARIYLANQPQGATMTLGRLISLMEILRFYAHLYVQKISSIAFFCDVIEHAGLNDIREYNRVDFLKSELVAISKLCEKADLPLTRKVADSALFALSRPMNGPNAEINPEVSNKSVLHFLERIRDRLPDELESKLFLQLPHSRKDFFDSPTKGWEEIVERFGDVTTDVEEMRKCFALSRYAGCVFHSLLVVEVGLIALGKEIGVTDPKPGWDATCSCMKRLLDGGHKAYPSNQRISYAGLEQINACAQAMKMAWRNKVSHAANALVVARSEFAPDVAEEIMAATRGFMRRLVQEVPNDQRI